MTPTPLYTVVFGAHTWHTVSLRRLAAIITVLSESTLRHTLTVSTKIVSEEDLKAYDLS